MNDQPLFTESSRIGRGVISILFLQRKILSIDTNHSNRYPFCMEWLSFREGKRGVMEGRVKGWHSWTNEWPEGEWRREKGGEGGEGRERRANNTDNSSCRPLYSLPFSPCLFLFPINRCQLRPVMIDRVPTRLEEEEGKKRGGTITSPPAPIA